MQDRLRRPRAKWLFSLRDLHLPNLNESTELGEERPEVLTVGFVASTKFGRTVFHV